MLVSVKGVRYDTDSLEQIGLGGQGQVYKITDPQNPHRNLALKVYDEHNGEMANKLSVCVNLDVYRQIRQFSTAPICCATDSHNRVVGFTMRLLEGYFSVADTADLGYCIRNKITLRRVAALFAELHNILTNVHAAGFLVGDFRGSNIQFKPAGENWNITFMDVDSWAINRNGVQYACTAIHPSVQRPKLSSFSSLSAKHDWYAFAHQFAASLLKWDPFTKGFHPSLTSDQRRAQGITCWDPTVQLTDVEKMHDFRFGERLINILRVWLSGQITGVFPRQRIIDFAKSLTFCKGYLDNGKFCRFEVSNTIGRCPRCNSIL